jgi:hypothetical protein
VQGRYTDRLMAFQAGPERGAGARQVEGDAVEDGEVARGVPLDPGPGLPADGQSRVTHLTSPSTLAGRSSVTDYRPVPEFLDDTRRCRLEIGGISMTPRKLSYALGLLAVLGLVHVPGS